MPPDLTLSAGEMIRTARVAAGLTQEAFADLLGVGQSAVSHWERDAQEPTLANYRRIAEVLDVPLGGLVGAA